MASVAAPLWKQVTDIITQLSTGIGNDFKIQAASTQQYKEDLMKTQEK